MLSGKVLIVLNEGLKVDVGMVLCPGEFRLAQLEDVGSHRLDLEVSVELRVSDEPGGVGDFPQGFVLEPLKFVEVGGCCCCPRGGAVCYGWEEDLFVQDDFCPEVELAFPANDGVEFSEYAVAFAEGVFDMGEPFEFGVQGNAQVFCRGFPGDLGAL